MLDLIVAVALQQGPNDVFSRHDKFPVRHEVEDCDTCPCLHPDGDHDCDDVSVPEPPTRDLAFAVMGVAGLVWVIRRKR
jgi:hypothetical protein